VIYQRLCNNSQIITRPGKKESEVELDREAREDI